MFFWVLIISLASLLLTPMAGWGKDWYIRPYVDGGYGDNSGTSYDNAFVLGPKAAVAVNPDTDVFSLMHINDNSPITFSSTGTLPTPLVAGTVYYAIMTTGSTFKVSATKGPGPSIDIIDTGTGTLTCSVGMRRDAGGPTIGDIVYICGTHGVDDSQGNYIRNFLTLYPIDGVIFDGNYPADPAIIHGTLTVLKNSSSWVDTGVNGVYKALLIYNATSWIVENGTPFTTTAPVCEKDPDATELNLFKPGWWCGNGTWIWIKPLNGQTPSNNSYRLMWSYKNVDLTDCSNVTVKNLTIHFGRVVLSNTNNCTIDGLKIDYFGAEGISAVNSNNNLIKNCTIEQGGNGIYFHYDYTNRLDCNNNTIDNCTIKYIDPSRMIWVPDNHAIGIQGGSGNVVKNCYIDWAATGITLYTDTFYGKAQSIEMSGNFAINMWVAGYLRDIDYMTNTNPCIVYRKGHTFTSFGIDGTVQLKFQDITQSGWSALNGNTYTATVLDKNRLSIPVDASGWPAYDPDTDPGKNICPKTPSIYGVAYDHHGGNCEYPVTFKAYNNIAVNCDYAGIWPTTVKNGEGSFEIYNNIVYNSNAGIHIGGSSFFTPPWRVKNNIVMNPRDSGTGAVPPCFIHAYLHQPSSAWDVECDNNNYYSDDYLETPIYFYEYGSFPHLITLAEWKSKIFKNGFGPDSRSLNSDPKFVNYSGTFKKANDFIADLSSPIIHAGVDVGLTKDFLGNPVYLPPDIGCYNNVLATNTTTKATAKDITWKTEGGKRGNSHLLVTVWVANTLGGVLSGANVTLELTCPNGKKKIYTGTTGSTGTVTFKYSNAPNGTYKATVIKIDASALGLEWDGVMYSETATKPM